MVDADLNRDVLGAKIILFAFFTSYTTKNDLASINFIYPLLTRIPTELGLKNCLNYSVTHPTFGN